MSSAEVAEVTAKNKTIRTAAAPDLPNKAAAADGAGKPALTSMGERTRMLGSPRSATAARPRVVENINGIANLFPTLISKWKCTLESSLPCETAKEIRLDTRRRAGGDSPLPISLVLEDGRDYRHSSTPVQTQDRYRHSQLPITLITPKINPFLDLMVT